MVLSETASLNATFRAQQHGCRRVDANGRHPESRLARGAPSVFFFAGRYSSGPVEIVKVGAEVARSEGPSALLQFAAVISVNLAVINSLPVPGLDGGQMVFVLAEIVSGKKLDR